MVKGSNVGAEGEENNARESKSVVTKILVETGEEKKVGFIRAHIGSSKNTEDELDDCLAREITLL